ncbi:Nudix family hydrolase [Amphritea balenae]|uniref:8-oxo-dGTP diphosphatase n=1 Tax=Amphritea balenae TaxID=452629 RepID=A0A3P1SSU1_9GAMM|nr:Nudix family hydrolase [Amphritea balenae]RRD00120.1 Nudix family hydrolase [Amphritea balenae]GGK76838.1 hypothetical protein GCM10007941_28690 [Amphritea balenae]
MTKLIHVAAAAIFNNEGQLLLALRDESQHQGGLWEFPGGKVEASENVRTALARELYEELGIEIDQSATHPLIQVPFHYSDKSVLLDVFRVNCFSGQPYGREGQPLKWVALSELDQYEFPAANKPIVNSLQLPQQIAITPELNLELNPDVYAEYVADVQSSGAQAIMLRAKHLDDPEQLSLYAELSQDLANQGKLLIWNGSVESANKVNVDALHLSSQRLMDLANRAEFSGRYLGASCHNAEQIRKAEQSGVDYITLSPVQRTSSHPDAEPMGWEQFARLTAKCALPVYALGGVTAADLTTCIESGGQGIAGISGFANQAN